MRRYHVYIDWTLELLPRPFYVGKGGPLRIGVRFRNLRHKHVARKYGMFRQIILTTEYEELALAEEIRLITEHRTYVYAKDWNQLGCNYTTGGEGRSLGPHIKCAKPETVRQKISVSMSGKTNAKGVVRTVEEKEKISHSLMGHEVSLETRAKISAACKGLKPSSEAIEKSRLGHLGKGRAVVQKSLEGDILATFPSARIAEGVTGCLRSHISQVCRGKRPHTLGFKWEYVDPHLYASQVMNNCFHNSPLNR